jgi:hypothetical protein
MDNRNLLKAIFRILIGLAFFSLIGLAIYQHQQIKKIKSVSPYQGSQHGRESNDRSSGSEYAGQGASRFLKSPAAVSSSDVAELNYQLQAVEEELDMVDEDLNKKSDRTSEFDRQSGKLGKNQFGDSYNQTFLRRVFTEQISDFVVEFNISSEDADAFSEILLARQMASQEIYSKARGVTNPTEEDRARFKRLRDAMNDEYDSMAADLLGKTVYREYPASRIKYSVKKYQVGNFAETLGPDDRLSDRQETALVAALTETAESRLREYADEIEAAENTYTFPSESNDPEHIDMMVERVARSHEDFLQAAQRILTPSQTEKLKTHLEQELERVITESKNY